MRQAVKKENQKLLIFAAFSAEKTTDNLPSFPMGTDGDRERAVPPETGDASPQIQPQNAQGKCCAGSWQRFITEYALW